MAAAASIAILALALAAPEPAPAEADRVLSSASNAFEYRDLKKVIELLEPWVHPPRFADAVRLLEARRLLGIAYHLEGRTKEARDEFSAILLQSPKTKLDPFVVPPEVIESFELVRRQMAPALAGLDLPAPPPPSPPATSPAAPHPALPLVPLGLGHVFGMDQLGWGLGWMALQLVGLATNLASYHLGSALVQDGFVLPADRDRLAQLHGAQWAGLGLFLAGYLGGIVQGEVSLALGSTSLTPSVVPGGAGLTVTFE